MTRVHLITGFLGTGKTTAILHLLANKPADEKWAVLVNEFGELGIDGAIIKQTGVAVREVPGGCLCCVAGLPFQIGLNMLIAREQPDVLLIEPSGLGHPYNILNMLQDEQYQYVLTQGATLCLLDPRHLLNNKYLENEAFVDQLQLADVVVANKSDLCSEIEHTALHNYLANVLPAKAAWAWVSQGAISPELLALPYSSGRMAKFPEVHAQVNTEPMRIVLPLAKHESFRRFKNQGQGHFSIGWLLKPELIFDAEKLRLWMSGLEVDRLKAIVCSNAGGLILNLRDGVLSEMPADHLNESRIEIIANAPLAEEELEQQLWECVQ